MERFLSLLRWPCARPLVVFLIVVVVYGLTTRGRPVLSHDSQLYVSISGALMAGSLAPYQTTESAMWTVVIFPSLIAAARSVAPTGWPMLVLVLNVLCGGLTGALLVWFVRRATRSDAAGAAALLFYLGAFDIILWVRFVLSDTLYTCLALLVYILALHPLVSDTPLRGRRFWLAVSLVVCFFTRPTSLVLVAVALMMELFILPLQRADADRRRRRLTILWVLVVAGSFAMIVGRAYIFHDVNRWPVDFMRPKLAEYASREKGGEVVWDRAEMNHSPTTSPADHIAIQGARMARFFQVTVDDYSAGHNVANALYYVPLYLFGVIGAWAAIRRGGREGLVAQATLLWIAGTALFIAVTILDYDWRYRLPVMPQFVILAAYGVATAAQIVARSRSGAALSATSTR
jgi:hypothetical protein